MKEMTPKMPIPNTIKKRLSGEDLAMIKYLASEGKPIQKLAGKLLDGNVENPEGLNLSNAEILFLHNQFKRTHLLTFKI